MHSLMARLPMITVDVDGAEVHLDALAEALAEGTPCHTLSSGSPHCRTTRG